MQQMTCLLTLALCAGAVDAAHATKKSPPAYGDYLGDRSSPATLRDCGAGDRISISKQLYGTGSPWRSFCYGRPAPMTPKRTTKLR